MDATQGMTSAADPRYRLRWTDPSGATQERELGPGELIVGRVAPCDLLLADPQVSGRHLRLRVDGDAVTVEDLGSRNGTYLNGEPITSGPVRPGDQISLGQSRLVLIGSLREPTQPLPTYVVDRVPPRPTEPRVVEPVVGSGLGVVPDELLEQPILAEGALAAAGVPLELTEYAALGGGLGSFVWVDLLRNSGVAAAEVAVVGVDEHPYAHYARLCQDSQIPPHERLRSNSDSCPDNLWGFPGYAVREWWRELWHGNVALAARIIWSIFGEPVLADTYTPRSGDVFRAIDREAARIGWPGMLRRGRIRAIRKSDQGRLLAVVSQSDEHQRRHIVVGARFLHFAPGYPALQFLPDLGEYRERFHDRTRVVNAYETHDHIYTYLREHGGTVILRGRGIVASRIIQRLWEERRHNREIAIVHVNRAQVTAGHRFGLARRVPQHHVEIQPFNWPKGCWGGELRAQLERSSDEERKRLLDIWGGTTTASRHDWRQILAEGMREGWYRLEFGTVREVVPGPDGRLVTRIASNEAGGGTLELSADFIIDCTGLVASPDRNPLLDELIRMYDLPLNPLGRLKVSNDFELEGLRHGDARCYMAGATTLGGPHAAVDSFLGLQYAALRAVDAMQRQGAPGVRRLNGWYSWEQWLKWARGVAP